MDEDADLPDPRAISDRDTEDRSRDAGRLVERLAELRAQLEMLAPEDRARGHEAIERIRQAQERIETLEGMLATARDREDDLTARSVRDRMRTAELEATVAELSAVAGRVSRAEAASLEAETDAAESRRLLRLAQVELEAKQAEAQRLASRNSELEADLKELADEVAATAVARTEAARLELERNVARERARTERRLAVEDRLRAAEAERRVAELQGRLRDAERRMKQLMDERHAPRMQAETAGEAHEPEGMPPVVEVQPTSAVGGSPAPSAPSERDAVDEDVIDLTGNERSSTPATEEDAGSEPDDVLVWTSPPKPGLFDRLLRGLWPDDEGNAGHRERDADS